MPRVSKRGNSRFPMARAKEYQSFIFISVRMATSASCSQLASCQERSANANNRGNSWLSTCSCVRDVSPNRCPCIPAQEYRKYYCFVPQMICILIQTFVINSRQGEPTVLKTSPIGYILLNHSTVEISRAWRPLYTTQSFHSRYQSCVETLLDTFQHSLNSRVKLKRRRFLIRNGEI